LRIAASPVEIAPKHIVSTIAYNGQRIHSARERACCTISNQDLSSFCRIAYLSQKCDAGTTHAILGLQAHMKPEAIDRNHRCFL